MSIFTSLIIALIVMLIRLLLQTAPTILTVFYHAKTSKSSFKTADNLSFSFISGAEIFEVLLLVSLYLVFILIFVGHPETFETFVPFLLALLCFAFSIFSLLFYFQPKRNSAELFFSKSASAGILETAKKVRTRKDALLLGLGANALEGAFILPLLLVLVTVLLNLPTAWRYSVALIYLLSSVSPLFLIRAGFKARFDLSDFTRFRVKNRLLIKLSLSFLFLLLTFILIYVGVTKNGF